MLDWLLHGTIPVGDGSLYVREVVGNLFGLASALLGMRRLVWAWPVGLVGNVLLQLADGVDLLVELLALAHHFLGALGRIPEVGIFGGDVQLGETGLGTIPVKDASSAARLTAWSHLRDVRFRRALSAISMVRDRRS